VPFYTKLTNYSLQPKGSRTQITEVTFKKEFHAIDGGTLLYLLFQMVNRRVIQVETLFDILQDIDSKLQALGVGNH